MTTTAAERAVLGRRWAQMTEWQLMIAAVVFLAAYAVPILNPDLPSWLLNSCRSLSWVTWATFVVDFAVRLFLADERLRYLVQHWYDVLVIVLPLLRPLRLLRLIPLLSVLNRRAQTRLRGRVAIYVAGGASHRLRVPELGLESGLLCDQGRGCRVRQQLRAASGIGFCRPWVRPISAKRRWARCPRGRRVYRGTRRRADLLHPIRRWVR
jgi:hypothetical protein